MTKAFSVASWNVEHFGATNKNNDKPKKPVGPIIDFLAEQDADVVAVYEVVGKVGIPGEARLDHLNAERPVIGGLQQELRVVVPVTTREHLVRDGAEVLVDSAIRVVVPAIESVLVVHTIVVVVGKRGRGACTVRGKLGGGVDAIHLVASREELENELALLDLPGADDRPTGRR